MGGFAHPQQIVQLDNEKKNHSYISFLEYCPSRDTEKREVVDLSNFEIADLSGNYPCTEIYLANFEAYISNNQSMENPWQ